MVSKIFDDCSCDNEQKDEKVVDIANKNNTARTKIFWQLLLLANALIICCSLYLQSVIYRPTKRDFCEDNLFCGNNLNISGQELSGILNELEEELDAVIPREYEDEYALLYAVMENESLTEEQKGIFYKFIEIIKDTPYIDRQNAYYALRNVEVLYEQRPFNYSEKTRGVYLPKQFSVGIFEDDAENSTLIHEGLHCIFSNDRTENLPDYFREGVIELLANEYFSDFPFLELECYSFEVVAVKMLCEVVSPEKVLEAYCCGDMDIIVNEIAVITKEKEQARDALTMLEKAFLKYNGDDVDVNNEQIIYGFIPLFREIVESRCMESGNDSSLVSYYYNEILFTNIFKENAYDSYVDSLVEFGCDYKAYFSSELKQHVITKYMTDKFVDDDSDTNIYVKNH